MNTEIKILQIGAENFGNGGRSVIAYGLTKAMRSDIKNDFVAYSDYEESSITADIRRRGKIYSISNHPFRSTIKLIHHQKYDLVHIHADHAYEALKIAIAAKIGGSKRIVVHAHQAGDNNYRKIKQLVIVISRQLLPLFIDLKLACSKSAAEYMYGRDHLKNVVILRDGIEIDKYHFFPKVRTRLRDELNLTDEIVIGNVGRLVSQKNQAFLIDVFSHFHKNVPNSKLLLIGSGDKKETLEKKINQLGLEKQILFLGNRSDVPNLLQVMDIFAFPSRHEGFGMAALEAQAAGLPTIISNNVPNDVRITDLCVEETINRGVDNWVSRFSKIVNSLPLDRANIVKRAHKKIVSSGYDLRESAMNLEDLYRGLVDGDK
ncbi:glycosyltransferase [Oenococcus oeni]|uniref:glycosyltransferase n=1 Tax=Oenococcus oeni TaxID=1247 RepID=UPI00067BC208|nr:glycosyltransferase [Oenococcus oeni]